MQHAHSLYLEPFDVVGRIQRALEDHRINRSRAKAFKKTVRALAGLTDHELSDIGISRDEIIFVARQCTA